MAVIADNLYHVFNQGNNRQTIFLDQLDYFHFLKLVRRFVVPNSEILAYCLMPNHFHFLLYMNEKSAQAKKLGSLEVQEITNAFRLLLSSFSAIQNKNYDRSGSWFRQRTKFELVEKDQYSQRAFHYIHQNPVRAGLVKKQQDWEFSSFRDYAGLRNESFCNQNLAFEFVGFDRGNFLQEAENMV